MNKFLVMRNKFGPYIRKLREERGLSERDLVDKLNKLGIKTTQGTINNIQNDRIDEVKFGVVIALSKVLDVPIEEMALVYEGKEPGTSPTTRDLQKIENRLFDFLKSIPPDILAEAFKKAHTPEQLKQIEEEAKKKS